METKMLAYSLTAEKITEFKKKERLFRAGYYMPGLGISIYCLVFKDLPLYNAIVMAAFGVVCIIAPLYWYKKAVKQALD